MQPKFPPDVEDFIHQICVKAVLRAIQNGTYKGPEIKQSSEAREK